jgi:hypothetical protein
MRLLLRNGFSINPKNFVTLFLLLQNSLLSSVLRRIERMKYRRILQKTRIQKPPIFIIGHWRTGSTFLHQLISLDLQFTTPVTVQTAIPDHFLISMPYYIPVMNALMPGKRPMDEVSASAMTPQEDEFALIRLGSATPLEGLFFPDGKGYFLKNTENYLPKGLVLETWKNNLMGFYKKITLQTGKQIVSKNPLHTMRMSLLADMFPGARFIHICRSPLEVIPSTIRMWNILADSDAMKKAWKKPEMTEVMDVYKMFLEFVARESRKLGPHQYSEVRFEALENNPLKELRRMYAELDLEYSLDFESRVKEFINLQSGFVKNKHHLTPSEKEFIRESMGDAHNFSERDN